MSDRTVNTSQYGYVLLVIEMRLLSTFSCRLFMTLKIRNVSKKDHGKYRCVISFANKTITNYAELSVHYPSVKSFGPVVVEKVESNRHTIPALANGNSLSNNDQQPAIEESMNGTCVPYGKGICQPFFHERIGTEYVFENANQRLDLVNKQLEEIINGLIKSDKLSARLVSLIQTNVVRVLSTKSFFDF